MIDKKIITRFNQAVQYEKDKEYIKALQEYVSILHEDKNYRDAYLNLGSLYSRMNKLKQAMNCFKTALSLAPDYITYFNIGCLYYKMENYKKSVIHLEKSRKLNNEFSLANLVIGLCYSRLNNIKAAKVNFIEVLKIKPDHKVALTALSMIYYNEKRYEEAIKILGKIKVKNNSNILVRELKYNILYRIGQLDESVKELKEIKQISDGYKMYDDFILSVPIEVFTDKYGTIDEKISQLNEQSAGDKNSFIPLSLCHLLKGDTDTAIDYLFEAKRKN